MDMTKEALRVEGLANPEKGAGHSADGLGGVAILGAEATPEPRSPVKFAIIAIGPNGQPTPLTRKNPETGEVEIVYHYFRWPEG